MKTLGTLSLLLGIALAGCGQAELLDSTAPEAEEADEVQTAAVCSVYMLDNANFTGPLAPFPLSAASGVCTNVGAAADNRTSSFRTTCRVRFFDGRNCTGASYLASTSGVMPAWFNNRASSLIFF